MTPKAEGSRSGQNPDSRAEAPAPAKTLSPAPEQGEAEKTWAAEREKILKNFREKRADLSQEVLSSEKLYQLGKNSLREIFVDNLKEGNGSFEGTFNPRNNTDFEIDIRLKHLVPPKYKYIEVRTAGGQLLKGTRRGTTSEEGDLRDMEDKEVGSFYTADGTYIPIWRGDNFKAYEIPPADFEATAAAQPAAATTTAPAVESTHPEAQTTPGVRPATTGERREAVSPLAETSEEETLFVGDSLSVGYLGYGRLFRMGHIPKEERTKSRVGAAVGGRLTGPMLADLRKRLPEQRGRVKKIVIFGGVNDLASDRTPEQIITNLNAMCGLARQEGLKVVMCTIPSWDTEKYATRERPDFCGPRHLTGEKLTQRTDVVNAWIRQQAGAGAIDGLVDLNAALGRFDSKEPGEQRGDSIHFRSYRKMASAVAKGANITV